MKKQSSKTTDEVSSDEFLAEMPDSVVPKLTILVNSLYAGSYLKKTDDFFLTEIKLANDEINPAEMYHLFLALEEAKYIHLYGHDRYNQEKIYTNKDKVGKQWICYVIESKLARGENEYGFLVKVKLQKKFSDLITKINLRHNDIANQASVEQPVILIRDNKGNYFLSGRKIIIDKRSMPYQTFDGAYRNMNHHQFTQYEKVESHLISQGRNPSPNRHKRNKRIQNALTNKFQGFFCKAVYENGNCVLNEKPDDPITPILKIVQGGVQFNI